jgi:hypothetical protein
MGAVEFALVSFIAINAGLAVSAVFTVRRRISH